MIEPKFRCGTRTAIDKVAKELNMPLDDCMQDWPYEVANSNEIDKYISHYRRLGDDEKFVLMQAIIQANEDQREEESFLKYWIVIQDLLIQDFHIHEYTVYYWSCFDNENIEDCWKISPFMRELFVKKLSILEP
ncbi:hypothetical protein L1276_001769 [Flavobacterium sp. HSC-32F16]|uniref:hypothetical protein n=1 Tax=Flavobacterium sp. HSC-32F16 TaxID=2910964 RepID=UPI0020A464D4|nr:hypothetical protein [Flavobacterium sp. HSC-32F16]MCP2026625.1 hypothetical protein [Flavobacterium sp. HSC-32F16]